MCGQKLTRILIYLLVYIRQKKNIKSEMLISLQNPPRAKLTFSKAQLRLRWCSVWSILGKVFVEVSQKSLLMSYSASFHSVLSIGAEKWLLPKRESKEGPC